MDNGKREFEELRNILQKLDRSLDEAQQKRTHGSTPPPAPSHGPTPAASPPTVQASPTIPAVPAAPAAPTVIPDPNDEPGEQTGRLKAKPLRRPRPENNGSSHGWVR
jgi:hypothetical protein